MPSAPSYMDRCAEIIEAIKRVDIAQLNLGERVGFGGRSATHALGEVELDQASIFLGVKLPTDASGRKRLEFELAAMDVVGGKIPEFISKFPAFIGYIALDEVFNPVALLTEDVTKGGIIPVPSMPLSHEARVLFKTEFTGGEKGALKSGDGVSHIGFDVDGVERFLDFTPSPINWGSYNEGSLEELRHQRYKRVVAMLPDLTVVISSKSLLGQGMSNMASTYGSGA